MEIVKVDINNLDYAQQARKLFFNSDNGALNEKFFEKKDNIMVVGILDKQVIAMVYGYRLERFSSKSHQLFIYSIDVLEKYQGQGYGKKILDAFLEPYYKGECSNAFVFTHENNINALKLYQSLGAKIINSEEGHDVLLEWTK
ncbi:MAG: GNAT family N-acetyltransferase [Candidatus Izemoplasmataceae bacterium]